MKNLLIILGVAIGMSANSQVAINTDSSLPDNSAMLDVFSTDKGILIPRMTQAQRNEIASPATGLMIYQLDNSPGYYYNSGSSGNPAWIMVGSGTYWSLTGNAGTTAGTNFLGSTDGQPLMFKANNQKAGYIDYASPFNTGFGYQSLNSTTGSYNSAFGYQALLSNSTGQYNTGSGVNALYSNTIGSQNTAYGAYTLNSNNIGNFNTASGVNALYNNTTGLENTAYGWQALYSNVAGSNATAIGTSAMYYADNTATPFINRNVAVGYEALRGSSAPSANTGNWNTALGYQSLWSNTNGQYCTASGYLALYSNTIGLSNTAIGSGALLTNYTGSYNTSIGSSSLKYNYTGSNNTACGLEALLNNYTGSSNTALGYFAFHSGAVYDNSTALGYNAAISASNQIRLGNSSITSIGGQVDWTTLSDGRFKKNVKQDVKGLEFIMKLRPVTYYLDMDGIASFLKTPDSLRLKESEAVKSEMLQTGFIAQEVEKASQEIGYEFSGVDAPKNENDMYGLRYAEFVVPLVKAVQEQQQQIEVLKAENQELKAENAAFEERLTTIESKLSGSE